MEWPRIKTIIILLLVMINAALLTLTQGQNWQNVRQLSQARASAITLLGQQGIAVEDDVVPRTTPLTARAVERDRAHEADIARAVLGEAAAEQLSGDVDRYTSATGYIQFHSSGEFLAHFSPGAFTHSEQTPAQHATRFLEQFGHKWQLLSTSERADDAGGQTLLVLRQTLDGVPVSNCRATVTYENGALVSVTQARRLPGPPGDENGASISVATALARFLAQIHALGDVCSAVTNITPLYQLSAGRPADAQLVPLWRVETDTRVYTLNLLDGTLARGD